MKATKTRRYVSKYEIDQEPVEIVVIDAYTVDGHTFDGPVTTVQTTQTALGPKWGDAEIVAAVEAHEASQQ